MLAQAVTAGEAQIGYMLKTAAVSADVQPSKLQTNKKTEMGINMDIISCNRLLPFRDMKSPSPTGKRTNPRRLALIPFRRNYRQDGWLTGPSLSAVYQTLFIP